MIKFGYTFLVIDLLGAAGFWYHYHRTGDPMSRMRTAMFLGGCILWTICLLIWTKSANEEQNDDSQ